MTVQEFVNSTFRLIRVLDSGETPTATESNDALAALNQLIGSWSAAGGAIYQEAHTTVPLTGAPHTARATRPVKITSAQVHYSGISFPVAIVPSQVWAQPKDRTATSKFAKELYYERAYPVGTMSLWPAPTTGSHLEVFSLKPL